MKLCDELLLQKNDNIALMNKIVEMRDDFLDLAEDMSDVNTFIRVQKPIFDSAKQLADSVNSEKEYFQTEDTVLPAIAKSEKFLQWRNPTDESANCLNLFVK